MNLNQKMKCIHRTKHYEYPTTAQSIQFSHEIVLKQTHMTIKWWIYVKTNYEHM